MSDSNPSPRHWLSLLTLAALLSVGVRAETTLRIGLQGLPPTMGNPYRTTGPPNIYTTGATFDGLTRIDEQGEVQPWLATHWENTGPLTWVLQLREGVYFSNGVAFDAGAVVNAIDYLQSEEALREVVARELDFIASARVLSANTVELRTHRPAPLLPRQLTILYMVEPGEWRRLGPVGFSQAPVGTGPFKVNAYKADKIELSAFDGSRRKPRVDRLELLAVPEAASRAQAVQSGIIDVAIAVGPDEVSGIEAFGGTGISYPGASVWAINFVDKPGSPFKDRRVREAINYAVNRDVLTSALLDGVALPANQPAPRICFGYNPELAPIPYDPERAKQLLADAGYPEGFKFVVEGALGGGAADTAMYQVVAQDLARVGIHMEIRTITASELIRKVIEGGWEGDAFGLAYGHEPSVDAIRAFNIHSCLWRHAWYCNEQIMPAIHQARIEFDSQRALELRHQIMAFYRNDYASLFLYDLVYFAGMSARVRGLKVVYGFIDYEHMWFEQ